MYAKMSMFILSLLLFSSVSIAEIIDPVNYIDNNGYASVNTDRKGVKTFVAFKKEDELSMNRLLKSVSLLPKQDFIAKVCNILTNGMSSRLDHLKDANLVLKDYGTHESTVICVNKLLYEKQYGYQVTLGKKNTTGMHILFITNNKLSQL